MSSVYPIIDVEELLKIAKAEEEQWKRRSIYKLPASVTNVNKTAYTPRMVSFGPYHYGNENLKEMESHKERALERFLKRSRLTYSDCLQSLLKIVGELMDAYDSLDSKLYNKENPNAFLDIMIRDGIFMLEIFGDGEKNSLCYARNDPIFSEHGDLYVTPHIKRDMLILENQIPLKVLHTLHRLQYGGEEEANKVVYQFFFPEKIASAEPPNSLHVLDMYRTVILGSYPPSYSKEKYTYRIGGDDIVRSAVELTEAGVKIMKSKSSGIRDISFKNGILRLPMIIVDDTTESLFLNLIAFERFHIGAGNDMTAYAFFMDNIIDDAQDIRILHSQDIIQNGIGSDKAAAKLFNSLSKDISLDKNNPLAGIYRSVNTYCKRKIPKYRAALSQTYFTNPWAIISFFAAILLFALTITQTIFSIMDFYKK